ncbi:CDP-glycerol glycerophosphotransferase family protein [Salinibacterium sp. SWN1162]|uniref:CDP-glycerol glycerophosphotransferase family protein n=1 Tax=Salinibacterium sp. SWN1162 TaxID=2792053 RepID=UPI0018CD3B2A|nr:CDP-glycerol glycerophosphotransferase family protein [Salinibacterium sp. SWN1162]MBH0008743.1 CDP-glycerol glycerophosphotransferase family protein [Salinibacterium sp. SWN1162]
MSINTIEVATADRGSLAKRIVDAAAHELAANALAIAGLTLALAGVPVGWALGVGAIALFIALIPEITQAAHPGNRTRPTGRFTLSRAVLAISIGLVYNDPSSAWVTWASVALLSMLIAGEVTVRRIVDGAIPYAAHVPGLSVRNYGLFRASKIFYVNSALLVIFGALALLHVSAWVSLVVLFLGAIPSAVVILDGIIRIRGRRIADRSITQVLTEYEPAFVVHWDAPSGTEYQLSMWLPYLERLNKRYFVIVRNQHTFDAVCALTSAPVLLRKTLVDQDAMVVPSLKAAFYVNNGIRNSHFVRFPGITHIQLNHGDSDKAPSHNPVFRMFDKNFVAGRAAIDRFAAHGVSTPTDFFAIVGRPQVESVQVGARPDADPQSPVVLYAPTWAGHNADSNYTSLPNGYEIVAALLQRGCTVIYRSHPYTHLDKNNHAQSQRIATLLASDAAATGRKHLYGEYAERILTMIECFNASDALISDISSVVPDFLFSGKPFAISMMSETEDAFIDEFPIGKAAYLIGADLSGLDDAIEGLLGADSLQHVRHELKSYYLGDFDDNDYASHFVTEALKYVQ